MANGLAQPICDLVTFAPSKSGPRLVASLQAKLQTNCATRAVIRDLETHCRSQNAKPTVTVRYDKTPFGLKFLELESRCAVIRTVGSNPPSPPVRGNFQG